MFSENKLKSRDNLLWSLKNVLLQIIWLNRIMFCIQYMMEWYRMENQSLRILSSSLEKPRSSSLSFNTLSNAFVNKSWLLQLLIVTAFILDTMYTPFFSSANVLVLFTMLTEVFDIFFSSSTSWLWECWKNYWNYIEIEFLKSCNYACNDWSFSTAFFLELILQTNFLVCDLWFVLLIELIYKLKSENHKIFLLKRWWNSELWWNLYQ